MSLLGDVVLWTAIPIGLLLIGTAIGAYWLVHRQPPPVEAYHAHAERAYFSALAGAAAATPPRRSPGPARLASGTAPQTGEARPPGA